MPNLTLTPVTLGKFCREIAVGLSPLPTLLAEWSVTPQQYAEIRESEGFKYEMATIVREMQEFGADAGYIYRMKALSEEFLGEIVAIMKDPNTGAGVKTDLIKFCADMGRLKEKPTAGPNGGGPSGPSVVFHFGAGLPVQNSTMTITADPAQPSNIIPLTPALARTGFNLEPADD
jgi:hypothetical protein